MLTYAVLCDLRVAGLTVMQPQALCWARIPGWDWVCAVFQLLLHFAGHKRAHPPNRVQSSQEAEGAPALLSADELH